MILYLMSYKHVLERATKTVCSIAKLHISMKMVVCLNSISSEHSNALCQQDDKTSITGKPAAHKPDTVLSTQQTLTIKLLLYNTNY